MDDETRALERRVAQAPDDHPAARRLAQILARRGEAARAARLLVGVVRADLTDAASVRELDALTRGGVDPASPWPGFRGDARGTNASLAAGPARGRVVAQRPVPRSVHGPLAVSADGTVYAADAAKRHPGVLVAIGPEGPVRPVGDDLHGGWPHLVAEGIVVVDNAHARIRAFADGAMHAHVTWATWSPHVAALGRLVAMESSRVLSARALHAPDRTVWTHVVSAVPTALAVAPGATLIAVVPGPDSRVERLDLASGRLLASHEVPGLSRFHRDLIVDAARIYLRAPAGAVALDGDGRVAWTGPDGYPLALVSADGGDVLVVRTREALVGVDAASGKVLWSRAPASTEPVVGCAGGRLLASAGGELVTLEARTARVVARVTAPGQAGFGAWAPAGHGRIVTLAGFDPARLTWME